MKLRIKNTPFWGEVVGNSNNISSPEVGLKMRDGSLFSIKRSELTDKTIKQAINEFILSVLNNDDSIKNQLISMFVLFLLGFIIGLIL